MATTTKRKHRTGFHEPLWHGRCKHCGQEPAGGDGRRATCPGRPLTEWEREQVEKWVPAAYRLSARHPTKPREDYEDDAQNAAVQMCESIRTFDAARGVQVGTHLYNAASFSMRHSYRVRQTMGFGGLTAMARDCKPLPIGPVVSLDDADDEGYEPWAQGIPARPEAEPSDLRPVLDAALQHLDQRARYVMEQRYYEQRNLDDIAAELGICKERVRQIITGSIARLKAVMRRA